MYKVIRYIIPAYIFMITVISCETEQVTTESQIVVNEFFGEGQPFMTVITESLNTFTPNNFQVPRDLDVRIYEDNVYKGNLYFSDLTAYSDYNYDSYFDTRHVYTNDTIIPVRGKEYRIEVFKDGRLSATASNTIPVPVSIEMVDTFSTIMNKGSVMLSVLGHRVVFNDRAETSDYYALTCYLASEESPGNFWFSQSGHLVSSESVIDGKYYVLNDSGYYGGYFLFNDETFNGQEFEFIFGVDKFWFFAPATNDNNTVIISLYSLSEEYYRYLLSVKKQKESMEDYYSEPDVIYSNIDGGLGVFAGSSVSTYRYPYNVTE